MTISVSCINKDLYFLLQTAFVRQKTPHPKELKAKAHKLFGGGGKKDDPDAGGGGNQDGGSGLPMEGGAAVQPDTSVFNNHVTNTSTPQANDQQQVSLINILKG